MSKNARKNAEKAASTATTLGTTATTADATIKPNTQAALFQAASSTATFDAPSGTPAPQKAKVGLRTLITSGAIGSQNAVILNGLVGKINTISEAQQGEFVLRLLKLNAVEWKTVGKSATKINEDFDAREKSIKDGNNSDQALKRLQQNRETVKLISVNLKLSESEAEFMTIANLLKTNLKPMFNELPIFVRIASIKREDRYSLEYVHNVWVAKTAEWKYYRNALTERYMKVLEALKSGQYGSEPVPADTDIANINALQHDPRGWMCWVSPRKLLQCKAAEGKQPTREEKVEMLTWVATVEAAVIKFTGGQATNFVLQKFEKGEKGEKGSPTPYWIAASAAFVKLNKQMVKAKKGNDEDQFIGWDEIEVDNVDTTSFIADNS